MRRRSRAVRILERLLADGVRATTVARTLGLSRDALDDVRSGRRALALWQQVLVAALAEARSPALYGEAAGLRAQLRATIEFRAGTTITHRDPPVRDR